MNFSEMTINEIKKLLKKKKAKEIDEKIIRGLNEDNRKGVNKLARKYERLIEKKRLIKEKWISLNRKEEILRKEGYKFIVGIDEAGRGPLAGPVVAAAVILDHDRPIMGLDDSKSLSEKKREELYDIIKDNSIAVGVGCIDNKTIDKINILQATFKAMKCAIDDLSEKPDYILVDGNKEIPGTSIKQEAIIDGDCYVNAIAAASIIAKVYRDRLICKCHSQYPEYRFDRNKGYGTKEHIEALKEVGPTPIHRYSFSIVNKYYFLHFKNNIEQVKTKDELKKLGKNIAENGLFSNENLNILRKLYKNKYQNIVNE